MIGRRLSMPQQRLRLLAVVFVLSGMTGGGRNLRAEDRRDQSVVLITSPQMTLCASKYLFAARFSPDGQSLVSAGGTNEELELLLWDLKSGRTIANFRGHTGKVYDADFSSDGKTIASGGRDRAVILWDVASGERRATCKGHTAEVNSVAFSPDCQVVVSGSNDHTVIVWDVATGERRRIVSPDQTSVEAVAFSPDGRDFVAGGLEEVVAYAASKAEVRRRIKVNSVGIWDLEYSRCGKSLAICGSRAIHLVDIARSAVTSTIPASRTIQSVALSADGMSVATGDSRVVHVFDTASGRLLASCFGHESLITSVCFSPDGKFVSSTGDVDKTIRIWELPQGIRPPQR